VSHAPLVVCVDDDAAVARALSRSFQREQLSSLATTEPEEALEWVLENEVAVLVSDFNMPVMNGVELASRVRQLRPTTVRILLTGNTDLDTAMASINQGEIFRFVQKPVHLASFMTVVHEAVTYHRELAAIAGERELAARREKLNAELEARYPMFTTPARAHDGAYLVQRRPDAAYAELGLESLLELRRTR